jgi:hypothetical protein
MRQDRGTRQVTFQHPAKGARAARDRAAPSGERLPAGSAGDSLHPVVSGGADQQVPGGVHRDARWLLHRRVDGAAAVAVQGELAVAGHGVDVPGLHRHAVLGAAGGGHGPDPAADLVGDDHVPGGVHGEIRDAAESGACGRPAVAGVLVAVYKQIASKTALGEAVIARETDRVLAGVTGQLRTHADPVDAITAAAGYVLDAAAPSPLVKALLTDPRSEAPDLLPLVTTRPELVMGRAIAVVGAAAQERFSGLPIDRPTIARVSEIIVRLTFSHLIQPTGPTGEALAQIRLLTEAILAGHLTAGAGPAPPPGPKPRTPTAPTRPSPGPAK